MYGESHDLIRIRIREHVMFYLTDQIFFPPSWYTLVSAAVHQRWHGDDTESEIHAPCGEVCASSTKGKNKGSNMIFDISFSPSTIHKLESHPRICSYFSCDGEKAEDDFHYFLSPEQTLLPISLETWPHDAAAVLVTLTVTCFQWFILLSRAQRGSAMLVLLSSQIIQYMTIIERLEQHAECLHVPAPSCNIQVSGKTVLGPRRCAISYYHSFKVWGPCGWNRGQHGPAQCHQLLDVL